MFTFVKKYLNLCLLISMLSLSGCSSLNPFVDSTTKAEQLATGFHPQFISAKTFDLYTLSKINKPDVPIHFYVEGDGRAWLSKHQLSENPTPKDMVFLKLATLDPHPNVVYIARPCQFVSEEHQRNCAPKYWSSHRNAPEVITAIDEAITHFKALGKSKKTELYGYSGGGGIVALVAARRDDVSFIATLCGNLDLKLMDEVHKSSPLHGSLDPIKVALEIGHIPQNHFVGSKDKVVPPKIAYHYKEESQSDCVRVHVEKGFNHYKGWDKIWLRLLNTQRAC